MNKQNIMGTLFDSMCAANNQIILSGQAMQPMILFITKDVIALKSPANIMPLDMTTPKKKQIVINEIKSAALKKEGVVGYIFLYDSTATKINDDGSRTTLDCAMRILYTPTEKFTNMQFHKGPEMLDNKVVIGRDRCDDLYDAWNECDSEAPLKNE